MRGNRSFVVPIAVLAAALLVLSSCGDDGTPAPGATITPPIATKPTGTPSATSSPIVDATEIEILVNNGEVESPGEVGVKVDDRVRIIVRADVTDEVHVHGYDLFDEVRPGHSATIEFTADVAGVFEVELESAGQLLMRLKVNP